MLIEINMQKVWEFTEAWTIKELVIKELVIKELALANGLRIQWMIWNPIYTDSVLLNPFNSIPHDERIQTEDD